MGSITVERVIRASPDKVFATVTDSDNLRLSSLVLRVKRIREGEAGGWTAGAVREVAAVGAWFREEITTVEPPRTFGYQILKSVPPITHFGGTIEVTPTDGGSRVVWRSAFDVPLAAGGAVGAAVFERILTFSFGQVLDRCAAKLRG